MDTNIAPTDSRGSREVGVQGGGGPGKGRHHILHYYTAIVSV